MKLTGIIITMAAAAAVAVSCRVEQPMEPLAGAATGLEYVGEPVEAHLDLGVSGYISVGTRSEDPTGTEEAQIDAEDTVNDIWIFQYDATSDDPELQRLISYPVYISGLAGTDLSDIEVKDKNNYGLSNNNGSPSLVYVVANTGDSKWVNSFADFSELDGTEFFATVKSLLATEMDSPKPYRMEYDADTSTYIADEDWDFVMPMSGNSGSVVIPTENHAPITVNLERMFAKVCVRVNYDNFNKYGYTENIGDYEYVKVYNVTVGSIPEYLRVGALGDAGTTTPANYPSYVQWLSRSFVQDESSGDFSEESSPYPYVIYVPENIQGEVEGATSKTSSNAPVHSLTVTAGITLYAKQALTEEIKDTVAIGPVTFTAYPGGNTTDNFNIRRNCAYYITLEPYNISEHDLLNPSANCIVCPSGQITTFYPYYRDPAETGASGFKFSDFVDPTYYDGNDYYAYPLDETKFIDSVEILWQSSDHNDSDIPYLGDNSNKTVVWLDGPVSTANDAENVTLTEIQRKIYVKVPSGRTGNAVVVAKNSDGDIIWSWHIWSRMDDPGNPANGKLYYTYAWDSDGIKYDQSRISGNVIMNCALGAMEDEPTGGNDYAPETYGMLYQWGRKDPFPPCVQNIEDKPLDYTTTYIGNYYDNNGDPIYMTATEDNALFRSLGGDDRTDAAYEHVSATTAYNTKGVGTTPADYITYSVHYPTVFLNPMTRYVNGGTYGVGQYLIQSNAYDNSYGDQYGSNMVNSLDTFVDPKDGNWIYDPSGHYNDLWGGTTAENKSVTFTTGPFSIPMDFDPSSKTGDSHEMAIYDNYGTAKSVFDPCPIGWRVASQDCWFGFTNVAEYPKWLSQINYSSMDHHGFWMYLTDWQSGSKTFFPCQGRRFVDGVFSSVGVCGSYWTAQGEGENGIYVNDTHFHYDGLQYDHDVFETEWGAKYEVDADGYIVYDYENDGVTRKEARTTGIDGYRPVLNRTVSNTDPEYLEPLGAWLDQAMGIRVSTVDENGVAFPVYDANGNMPMVTTSKLIGHFSLFELKCKANAHPVRCVRFDSVN